VAPRLLVDHALGALAGFVSFAAIAGVYRRARGREGLGLGDAKLLAAAGA
jgi:leader peptidase (prepilin peptidase)/N-methyltransferase